MTFTNDNMLEEPPLYTIQHIRNRRPYYPHGQTRRPLCMLCTDRASWLLDDAYSAF